MGCQIIHILLPCSLLATHTTRFCSFRSDSYRYCCSFFWTGLYESIIQESDDSDLAVCLQIPQKNRLMRVIRSRITLHDRAICFWFTIKNQLKWSIRLGTETDRAVASVKNSAGDTPSWKWNARKIIRIWHLETKSVLNNKGFETFLENNIHQYIQYTHYSN